ncbi:MAG: VC0807 family protein [Verrucomicrobiales bacterium]
MSDSDPPAESIENDAQNLPEDSESPSNVADPSAAGATKAKPKENPLMNILINVLIPVVALSALSKEDGKLWQIGPLWGMIVAVAFPVVYGVWDLISRRKVNFFSVVGIIGVLLTGGITLYVWNEDGTVKGNAAFLFAVKEATIPTVFAILILGSHFTGKPLMRLFLYNPDLFDVPRIERAIKKRGEDVNYQKALFNTTCIMAASFLVSASLNYFLAMYFLKGEEHSHVAYNDAIGKLTGWGYLVIGVPCMVIWFIAGWLLVKRLKSLTDLEFEDMTVPR